MAEYPGTASTYHASGISLTDGATGSRFFYRENALGSSLAVVASNGNPVSRTEYDGYGVELPILAGTNSALRYAGKHGYYKDDSSGLNLLGQRFYSARLGRFLTQDPIGHSGGLNLYAYCDNSPLANVDPDGTRPLNNDDWNRFRRLKTAMRETFGKNYHWQYYQDVRCSLISEIKSVKGTNDPVHLRALWWAIDNLSNSGYAPEPGVNKCNKFVYDAYLFGAGVRNMPWRNSIKGRMFGANEFGDPANAFWELRTVASDQPGEIVSFLATGTPSTRGQGHMTMKVANGLLIYAGPLGPKVDVFSRNMKGKAAVTFRQHRER